MFFKNDVDFIPAQLEEMFRRLYGQEEYFLWKKKQSKINQQRLAKLEAREFYNHVKNTIQQSLGEGC